MRQADKSTTQMETKSETKINLCMPLPTQCWGIHQDTTKWIKTEQTAEE